jgi:hypothetical protein
MASAKTATLTFRIEPELKEAVRTAADNEHRSIANMIAVMIRDYCGRAGVEIKELPTPHVKTERTPRVLSAGHKPKSRKQ